MADQTFDVVIVGGGNKALITAMYLTKYGKLSVGIFEDRNELGGGWCQEEPAGGFIGNPCSMGHAGFYHIPVYQDFPEWKEYGARYAYTKASVGTSFEEDDSCFIQYTCFEDVDPTQEKTAAEIARYSQKDADTYLSLWKKFKDHWEPALLEHFFNPAKPLSEPDALEKLVMNPEAGIDPLWLFMSPLHLYKELFEDTHMRQAFLRGNQSLAFEADQAGSGLGAMFITMWWFPQHCYAVGSSHALAHASHKVILENGGKVFTNHNVEKILIENGRAKGIKLSDGSEIEATKGVVTTVDPYQLCFDLIGKEHLPSRLTRRVENIERDWVCLMWYTWALKERPRWKCEDWNPDAGECMWMCPGDLDLENFKVESSERKMFQWPSKTNLGVAYHGPSDVNPGDQCIGPPDAKFTILTEQFVVPAWTLTEEEWKVKEREHAEEVVEVLHKYAPNVSWDIISGYMPITPYYTAHQCKNYAPSGNWCVIDNIPSQYGKLRPIPEMSGHRVPGIEGLYPTGSAWHPWGSAHSAQGYNCYKVMAGDLNLPKPWENGGRPF